MEPADVLALSFAVRLAINVTGYSPQAATNVKPSARTLFLGVIKGVTDKVLPALTDELKAVADQTISTVPLVSAEAQARGVLSGVEDLGIAKISSKVTAKADSMVTNQASQDVKTESGVKTAKGSSESNFVPGQRELVRTVAIAARATVKVIVDHLEGIHVRR